MGWMARWWRRIGDLIRFDREARDVEEEMRFHIDMETRDLMASGVPPAEAARRARLSFGGVERHREGVREARGSVWLDDLRRDAAYAVRSLSRSSGFTLAAVCVLSLGIGATSAVFGVVRNVLLDPLPYPESDRLVRVWNAAPDRGADRIGFSVPDQRDWAEAAPNVTALAAWTTILGDVVLSGEGPAEEIRTAYVAGDFFGVFGVPAALGRTLRPAEEEGANRVVVFSHGYWTRRFGADPSLLGRTLTLDEQPFEVVGVMPAGFAAPSDDTDAWVFLSTVSQSSVPWRLRSVRFLSAAARLAPDVDPTTARAGFAALASGLAAAYPDDNAGLTGAAVVPLRETLVGDVRASLWVAFGAVGLLLLLACANVANLLLARGSARRVEMALRSSLGASRGRLLRQLLTESALLGVLGGAGGVAVALGLTAVFRQRGGAILPRSGELGVDAGVLAFAAGLAWITTMAVGGVPALRSARVGTASELRRGGAGGGGTTGAALRRTLVTAEVGLALVLVTGSVLLARSVVRLQAVDVGFEPASVAAMTLTLSTDRYPERDDYMAFYRAILEGVERIPGVQAVGSIRRLPLRGGGEQWGLAIPGIFEPGPEDDGDVEIVHVGGDLFEALGIELLAGRAFEAGDDAQAEGVVVVDRTFADTYLPVTEPVGRAVVLAGGEYRIIGVVEGIRNRDPRQPPSPTVYVHQEQNARVGMAIVARVVDDPAVILPELRAVVQTLDPGQPVTEITLAASVLREATALPRLLAGLFGSFAGLAGLLAGLGIYGVVSYAVRQKRHETSLRIALGADRSRVVRGVLRSSMAPVLAGIVGGVVGAITLARVLEAVLFGVGTLEWTAYAASIGALLVVAAAATLVPALRAARAHPMEVLRGE